MLTAYRYLLAFTPEQEEYADEVGAICRSVWNTALEQRRIYRQRGSFIGYFEQAAQIVDAKREIPWLAKAPSHTLQQTLRDLDRACRRYDTWNVHWKSKRNTPPAFRFPDSNFLAVRRMNARWGEARLPKFGWVRLRLTRDLKGKIRNATVTKDGGRWYVSFCVEDGLAPAKSNRRRAAGVDRGVAVAVATSDGQMRDRANMSLGEAKRLRRLQQQLSRQRQGSNRRAATKAKIGALNKRVRDRRGDFAAWTANWLTSKYGVVVVEDLQAAVMTRSAKGTIEKPGMNVRAKSGLNRAILDKGWGRLVRQLEHKARYNGSEIVKINPAYTSQTCHACKHVDPKSRDSQAVFRCTACGHQAHADVNAARNILAAGLAVTGRGDRSRSTKRQPSKVNAA